MMNTICYSSRPGEAMSTNTRLLQIDPSFDPESCDCRPGFEKTNSNQSKNERQNLCKPCKDRTYSSQPSNVCKLCPPGSVPSEDSKSCVCLSGFEPLAVSRLNYSETFSKLVCRPCSGGNFKDGVKHGIKPLAVAFQIGPKIEDFWEKIGRGRWRAAGPV